MRGVEFHFKVRLEQEEPGLWLEEAATGKKVRLPPSALRALADSLREAGEAELATKIEALHRAAVAARRLEEAKQRCMDVTYSSEEYRRCLEILWEDLKG